MGNKHILLRRPGTDLGAAKTCFSTPDMFVGWRKKSCFQAFFAPFPAKWFAYHRFSLSLSRPLEVNYPTISLLNITESGDDA